MKLWHLNIMMFGIFCTIIPGSHPEATWGWHFNTQEQEASGGAPSNVPGFRWHVEELADVPMAAAIRIPVPIHPNNQPQPQVAQNSGPGILQTVHDTINNRPSRTK